MIRVVTLLFLLTAFTSCNGSESVQNESVHTGENIYKNPVVNYSLPDPTIIRADDGYFYLYATEDIQNTHIYRSRDLVNWVFLETAFTDDTRPTFEPRGGLWAPDINYIGGQYVMYYSMSV